MHYRFAICDDDPDCAAYIRVLAAGWAQQAGAGLETEVFPSAEAFLFRYEEQKDFDLLLLDIEMAEMDGLELARLVRQKNQAVQIVFISGYEQYIAQGYEVEALHYLVKPVDEKKFRQVLDRAVSRLKRSEPVITLEMPAETLRLPLSDIRSLEVQKNYVTVHAREDYTIKQSLGELERRLDDRFFRVGRSWIVNLTYIRRVTRTQAELTTGEAIPLPRGQYEKLNRAIIERM